MCLLLYSCRVMWHRSLWSESAEGGVNKQRQKEELVGKEFLDKSIDVPGRG